MTGFRAAANECEGARNGHGIRGYFNRQSVSWRKLKYSSTLRTMDFPGLEAELRRLGAAVEALAVIGATLRLRETGREAHPAVQARLREALDAVLPDTIEGMDRQQVSAALALVTFRFEEAMELFHNPDRIPAWTVRDPAMLQAQGQASRQIVRSILELAPDRPKLAAALHGRFLDVGTGVAAIALEAAECCPELQSGRPGHLGTGAGSGASERGGEPVRFSYQNIAAGRDAAR
jgi:hypothetical protein